MNENEKIKQFIDEKREILVANQLDIAHSYIDNTWFVFRFSKSYSYYEFFIEFETVEELIDIIIQELTFDLRYSIDTICPTPGCEENNDIADILDNYYKETNCIPELTACFKVVADSEIAKNIRFFEHLKTMLNYKNITLD